MKLPESTKVIIDRKLLKETRAGMQGKVEYNVMWAPKEKQTKIIRKEAKSTTMGGKRVTRKKRYNSPRGRLYTQKGQKNM